MKTSTQAAAGCTAPPLGSKACQVNTAGLYPVCLCLVRVLPGFAVRTLCSCNWGLGEVSLKVQPGLAVRTLCSCNWSLGELTLKYCCHDKATHARST